MSNVRQPETVVIEATKSPKETVMIDAVDQNVATAVIYTTDGVDFTYDEDGEIEVKAEDMLNLFLKGVVAVKGTTYYKAVSCTAAGVIDFGITA